MPLAPIVGKDALAAWVRKFEAVPPGRLEVRHQVSSGDAVMNERTDSITLNGKPVTLPICAVFEVEGGRIRAWREYFDLAPAKARTSPEARHSAGGARPASSPGVYARARGLRRGIGRPDQGPGRQDAGARRRCSAACLPRGGQHGRRRQRPGRHPGRRPGAVRPARRHDEGIGGRHRGRPMPGWLRVAAATCGRNRSSRSGSRSAPPSPGRCRPRDEAVALAAGSAAPRGAPRRGGRLRCGHLVAGEPGARGERAQLVLHLRVAGLRGDRRRGVVAPDPRRFPRRGRPGGAVREAVDPAQRQAEW